MDLKELFTRLPGNGNDQNFQGDIFENFSARGGGYFTGSFEF